MNVSKNNFRDDFEKIVSLLILMINSKIIQTSLMKIQMSPMILIINQTNNSHLETHKDVKEDVTKLLIKTENLVIKIHSSNANGSLDDRHDEDSFNELQHNQQENHLDNEPIHKDDKLSSEKTLIMMLT